MITVIVVLGMAIFLISLLIAKLADAGLTRLEGPEILQDRILYGMAFMGCALGGLFGFAYFDNAQSPSILHFVSILFFGLLLTGAWVDYKTNWAPLELQIPTTISLGIVGLSCAHPSLEQTIGNGLLGLSLWGLAWFLWPLQTKVKYIFIPPMDLVAICIPVILFGGTGQTVLFYAVLAVVLTFVRYLALGSDFLIQPGFGTQSKICEQKQNEAYIPLLAVVYPLTIFFMLWEATHDNPL